MRIAILMVNTDDSAFARAHADDGAKFTALIQRARPDWHCEVFRVIDGVFPPALDFDGMLITGSPASVHDDRPWIAPLEALVRAAVARGVPLFGACFGHQIIAKALGGTVGNNPQGWVLGRIETVFTDADAPRALYAAHTEQVMALPARARITARTPGCPVAGFVIDDHVLTTQYHPEMTPDFIAALLEAFADQIGRDVTAKAALTLGKPVDTAALAQWITGFFERAQP